MDWQCISCGKEFNLAPTIPVQNRCCVNCGSSMIKCTEMKYAAGTFIDRSTSEDVTIMDTPRKHFDPFETAPGDPPQQFGGGDSGGGGADRDTGGE